MEKSEAEDVTAEQPINKKHGIEFQEGTKLEAKDHLGDKWWEAKVLEVDSDGHEVLVHFIGWNGRHDEWIKMDSPRLQPFNRNSRRDSGGSVSPASTTQTPVSSSEFKEFKAGEKVMALWTNSCKYPAEILTKEPDGSYLVQFYDGYKKALRGHLIRPVQPDDLPFIDNCKTELAAQMKGQSNGDAKPMELRRPTPRRASAESRGSRETSPDLSPPPVVTCEKRRERKKKFNVREVLNLKGERESRTPEPDSKSKKVLDDSEVGRNSSRVCRQSSEDSLADEKLCKSSLVQEKLSKSSDEKISKSSSSNQSNYVKDVKKDSENNVNDVEEALINVGWDAVKKSDDVFVNDFNEHALELDSKSVDGKDEYLTDSVEALQSVTDADDVSEKKKSKALEKIERQKKVVEREIEKRRFYEGFPGSDGEECNHNNVSEDSEVCLKCDKNSPIRTGKVEVDLIQPVNLSDSPSQQSNQTLTESVDTGSEGTPSEKENLPGRTSGLNSVNLSKVDEKNKNRVPRGSLSKEPILQDSLFPEIKGKRARKRKRFADEEPEFPVSKITKILAAKVGKKLPEARLPSSPSTKPRNSKSTKTDSSKLRTRSKSRDTALETLTPKKRKRHSDRPVKKDSKKALPLDSSMKSKEKLVTKKTNSVVRTTNSIVKTTNSIVKTTQSVIKSTNASAKTSNSVVKSTNAVKTTNTVVKTTSPIAKAVDKVADTIKQPSDNNIHKYLTIDFSLSPTEISKQLVEGVTIPGATEPLVMSSPKLPAGWQKKVLRRALGTSAGKWEVFIENTNGKSFKSRVELTKHFEVEKLNFNIDDFDFCLDSTLKKLRQIWKTHLSNSTNETSKQEMSEDPVLKGLSVDQGEVLTDVVEKSEVVVVDDIPKVADSSVISVKSDDNKSDVKVSLSTDKSKPASVEKPKPSFNPVERPKLTIPSAQNSRILAQNKGNSTVAVTGNVSDTGQGVRCPLKNCNKLFRNEKLLQMHVKHYHPEYNQLVAHSPSVTDLAFHRTRLGLNFQELETGGTFQETLKKAERKVERQISKHGGAQISKSPDPINSPTIKRPINSQPSNSTVSPNTPVTKLPSPPSSSPPKPAEPLESPKKIKPEKEDKKAVKKRKHSPEEGLKSPGAAQPEKKVKTMLPQKKTESLGSLESVVPDGNGGVQQQQQQQQAPESEAKKVTRGRPRRDTNTETPSKPIIKMEPTPTTKTRPKRIRNDSILSVGSESTLAQLTPPTSPVPPLSLSTRPPPTPSTPPTYRVSKRRQLQLHGQGEGAEEKEVEEKEKEKEEEEVVNCGCGRNEEDGLMIQCDICLCWQHGLCLEIHKEEQVPEKYICAICRKPRSARQSVLYTVDQDWLKEGRLTYLPSSPPRHSSPPAPASPPPPLTNREAEFKKLSDLMADLSSMSAVLHSLRVKLAVAGQASNPKVFMWSSPWESSAPSTPPPNQDEAWQRGAAWEGPGARQPFLFPADIPDNPGDFMAAAETQLGLKQNSLQHIQQNSLQHIQQNSLQQIQQSSLQHIQQNSLQQIQQNMSALMQQKPIQNASLQSESDNTLTVQQSEMSKEAKPESESAENSVEVKGSDKAALVNNASSNSRDAESATGDPSQRIVDKSAAEPSAEESCQRNQRSDDPTATAFSTSKDPGVSESSKSSEQDGQGTSGGGSGSEPTREKSGISQSPVPEVLSENLIHETEKQNDFSQSNSSGGKHLINGEIQDNLTERASKSEANGVYETNASDDKDPNKASCQEREDALNCCPPSDAPTNEANLCLSDSSFHQNESAKHIDDSSSSFPASVDNSQNSFNEMNDSGQSNDDLSDYISGIKDVFDFPTNLIPSVSEVQRLLPGIIQSVTGGGLEDPNESFDRDVSSFRLPPNVIVEPKRLDREECRVNLIQHVENLQGLVEDSFDKIEARLIALESGEEVPPLHETDTHFPRAKSVLILLLRDLKTAKKLNLSLPEKI